MEAEEERDGDGTTAMFYSNCLLSKKGSLSAIWISACCFKRIKKRQITDTYIPSSVDTILREGLPTVTYRILAYLLLGVVRIYSRKVEYLLQDCHEILTDVNRFSVGKEVVLFKKDIICSSYSIILPERYELDSFQLDIPDVTSRCNDARAKDITLKDARKEKYTPNFSGELPYEQVAFVAEQNKTTQPLFGNTLYPEGCPVTPLKLSANLEAFSAACTPPDKVLSPHQMEIDPAESSANHMKAFQTSKEKLRDLRFTQEEDCMDICEADIELLNLINDYKVHDADRQGMDDLEMEPLEKLDHHAVPKEKEVPFDVDKAPNSEVPEARGGDTQELLEMEPLEKLDDHVVPEEKEVPFEVDKTPNSEVPKARGGDTQELLVVPTPAKKENIQRPGKRKCVIDVPTVLDSHKMKQGINDASDLVSKRRKVPHTIIDMWRSSYIPTLSKKFFEPLLPCDALELLCRNKKKKTKPSLLVLPKPIETTEAQADEPQDDVMAPPTPTNSRVTIAPGTPVLCPVTARPFMTPMGVDSDGEGPFHSYEDVRKESSIHDGGDSGPSLMDEIDVDEGDSQEYKTENGLSARTRTVAKYLHRVIHEKKQQGEEESIPLLPILKHKTRAQNARFFFEILVLTTGGLVNVIQERPYDNVFLQETLKMEATLANF